MLERASYKVSRYRSVTRTYVRLNDEPLQELDCFKNQGWQFTVDRARM